MTEKICDFCGEPIAGGLQEHDFATCAHNLKDKVAKLEAALSRIKVCATVPLTVWSVVRAKRCLRDIHRIVDEALRGES